MTNEEIAKLARLADHLEEVDPEAFSWLLDLAFTHDEEAQEAKDLIIKCIRIQMLNTPTEVINGNGKYEVWAIQGQGSLLIDEFDTLKEALEVAENGTRNKEASFGIKYPTGEWHKWN